MIQLKVLSGKMAGSTSVARRFPFRVGRAPSAGLVVEEAGVWENHFHVEFEPGTGFVATPQGEALLTVNGEPVRERRLLRNGDSIEIGGARLQFWLGETRQSGMRLQEVLVWAGVVLVTLAQVVLIYCLLQ
jgi:pSer/pThr/pTyr-binding forkhead associated (FHA) protein